MREVVSRHGGRFPATEAELRALPGIGDYTAAAIAAIAFGARATPIDGNIERVIARLFAVATPLPAAKVEIKSLALALTPDERAGDFAQAMMDLGPNLCSPRRPACDSVPWFQAARVMREAWRGFCPIATQRPSVRHGGGSPLWRCAMTMRCCCASGR